MKPSMRRHTAGVLLLLLAPSSGVGQEPAAPQSPVLRSDTLEVLVDVVIRDKKGRMIPGLRASDFIVKEDGVEQGITSVREIRTGQGPMTGFPPKAPSPEEKPQPVISETGSIQLERQVRLASLVYDRLGPAARRLARDASLEFLKHDLGPNTYYAVFHVDRGFRVLQPYTNDPERLRAAVLRATSGERSNFSADGFEAAANSTRGSEGASDALASASQGGRGPGPVEGMGLSAEVAARMVQEMADLSEMVDREDLGRMSVFSLWGIVKELKKYPGRKSVLYFTEGLQMPTGLVEQYKSMLSDANLANVSIYPVDARGLTTASDQTAANAKLAAAAQWSRYVTTTEHESFENNKQEFRSFDRALDSLRANAQYALVELAESTGGFLLANTNDFRGAMDRLSEEFRTYYEITYRPKNQLADGKFRAISVAVKRPDARVQARDGYVALPALDGQPVFPWELPLLKVLSKPPLPREVEFRSKVLQFRQQGGMAQAMLVFDLPMQGIAFTRDEKARKYRTHVTALALVKDEQGRVVAKLTRDVPLNEPLDRGEGFRQGRFIATRTLRLPPGRYTLETVVADYEANRVGARRSVLVIPRDRAKLNVSEMCLIRRVDRLPEVRDLMDPFQLSRQRIIPTLIDHIAGGKGQMMSVYLALYPEEGAAEKPRLVLDLLRDGKVLARSMPDLPLPEITGMIPFVANTPLDNVKPGGYEFRATLLQGEHAAQQSLYVFVD